MEPQEPRLAESSRSMWSNFLAFRYQFRLHWLMPVAQVSLYALWRLDLKLPSVNITPTHALMSRENSDMIEFIVTSWGHWGSGLFSWTKSVETSPARVRMEAIRLDVSNVQLLFQARLTASTQRFHARHTRPSAVRNMFFACAATCLFFWLPTFWSFGAVFGGALLALPEPLWTVKLGLSIFSLTLDLRSGRADSSANSTDWEIEAMLTMYTRVRQMPYVLSPL